MRTTPGRFEIDVTSVGLAIGTVVPVARQDIAQGRLTLCPAMLRGVGGPLGCDALCALCQFAQPMRFNGEAASALHVLKGSAV